MLSGRGLGDELITRPEESYRLCCVVVCDLETSRMGALYIYDISRLRVNKRNSCTVIYFLSALLMIILGCFCNVDNLHKNRCALRKSRVRIKRILEACIAS